MSPWSTVAWDAVQASEDDRSLRVLFTVGECTVDSDLSVDENDQQVVVTLRQQKMMASCNLIGLSAEERVPLADPLGSRPVIDGSCATKCEPANVGRVSD